MTHRGSLALLAMAALIGCAAEPTYRSLLERHIEARGGRDALESLAVIEREGEITFFELDPVVSGSYRTCVDYPDRVVIDIDAGPVQLHQVLGENGALVCDREFSSCSPAPATVEEELRSTARSANQEELEDRPPADSAVEILYEDGVAVGYRYQRDGRTFEAEFDTATGLEHRRKIGPRQRRYGRWTDAGGVLLPRLIEDSLAGEPVATIELHSARHTEAPSAWCLSRFSAGAPAASAGD